jgi:hypothetical protein
MGKMSQGQFGIAVCARASIQGGHFAGALVEAAELLGSSEDAIYDATSSVHVRLS